MKKILSAIAAVFLLATNAQAIEINRYLSGSWFNPEQSGHGFSIEVLSDTHVVAYWYVYDTLGYPIFLNTVGAIEGDTISGKTYYYEGMKFGEFNPEDNNQVEWGEVSISFDDCNNAVLNYESNYPEFGSGSLPLKKLVGIDGMGCSENPMTGSHRLSLSGTGGEVATGMALVDEDGYLTYELSGRDALGAVYTERGWTFVEILNEREFSYTMRQFINGEYVGLKSGTGYYDGLFIVGLSGVYTGTETQRVNVPIEVGSYDLVTATGVVQGTVVIDSSLNTTFEAGSCKASGYYELLNLEFNVFYVRFENESGCNFNLLNGLGYSTPVGQSLILFDDNTKSYKQRLRKQ